MPLHGNLTDEPDWVFNGHYSFDEDRVSLVQSVTELVHFTATDKTHLILATKDVRQWYADVTLTEPGLAPVATPANAPDVILAADGRIWKAIHDADEPEEVVTRIVVGTVADIIASHDPAIRHIQLLNDDADDWYFLDTSNPAADPYPPEAPNVVIDADGNRWSRVHPEQPSSDLFMQNAEIS
ncbi:hypothetical protein [uncultured Pelagimonas sp.]|uniref:hypothetical protein n=1 Tax=uncultured Pelagimonas sp. TaxID=1618102 RepID=UPI00262C1DC1|nr:hypothetical protein [uncultured Pelagimonas sp.]